MQKQRQVVVIPLSSPLFEEAVFFLRRNANADENSIISEAERIARSCLCDVIEPKYMYKKETNRKKVFLSIAMMATIAASALAFFLLR